MDYKWRRQLAPFAGMVVGRNPSLVAIQVLLCSNATFIFAQTVPLKRRLGGWVQKEDRQQQLLVVLQQDRRLVLHVLVLQALLPLLGSRRGREEAEY